MNKIKKEIIRKFHYSNFLDSYEESFFNENGVIIEKKKYQSGWFNTDEIIEKHTFQDGKPIKTEGLEYEITFDYYEDGFNKSIYSTLVDQRNEVEKNFDYINDIQLSMKSENDLIYTEFDHLRENNSDKVKKINTLVSTEQTIFNKNNLVESIKFFNLEHSSINSEKLFYYDNYQNLTKVIIKTPNSTEIIEYFYSSHSDLLMTKITITDEDSTSIVFDRFYNEIKNYRDSNSKVFIKKHYQICNFNNSDKYYISELYIDTKLPSEVIKDSYYFIFDPENSIEIDHNKLLSENDIMNFDQLEITDQSRQLYKKNIKEYDNFNNLTIEKEYLYIEDKEELNFERISQNIYNLEDFEFSVPAQKNKIKLKSVVNFYSKRPSSDEDGRYIDEKGNYFQSLKEYEYY